MECKQFRAQNSKLENKAEAEKLNRHDTMQLPVMEAIEQKERSNSVTVRPHDGELGGASG